MSYTRAMVNIRGCGFFFPFPVPSDEVLCSMKISAMLSRHKGRDFYDVMFLLSQAKPDFDYLSAKHGIHDLIELKKAVGEMLKTVNLNIKKRDFEHLLFYKRNSERILLAGEFFREL
jgi:predicted nucleotidyltransferase component of viral defense system